MSSFIVFFTLFSILFQVNALNSCNLPVDWYGKWYQSKYTDLKTINRLSFIDRGQCIESRQDKYILYEKEENCYRCVFIMQKHHNVLQYRASYCTEHSDFYTNCNNLTPESELMTIYRHDPTPEKCPLSGLYAMSDSIKPDSSRESDRSYRNTFSSAFTSNECSGSASNKDSKIMQCSDDSMLKLQFGKCTNIPTFIIQCTAHWTEGNTNYLIGKVFDNKTQESGYRCLAYSEISTKEHSNTFANSDSNFIDLASRNMATNSDRSRLQIHVSQYEFCRNIDNVIDEQLSFSFKKVIGVESHIAPPPSISKRHSIKTHRRYKSRSRHDLCKFPRWLNKKWRDLKQTKLFMLDARLNSLLIMDEKNSVIINKYSCEKMRSKRISSVQAIVKSLHGCSIGYQCLTISKKSDFVLELKFGRINYDSADIDCNEEDYISKEFVFVDTAYGVTCPLKQGLYEKLDTRSNDIHKALLLQEDSKYKFVNKERYEDQSKEPCKYLTQTQTLQVGCQNDQQYSLRTKLCYPNQEQRMDNESDSSIQRTQYTQIESEIDLVCLAHWKQAGNQIIVSRTMTDEILCSVSVIKMRTKH